MNKLNDCKSAEPRTRLPQRLRSAGSSREAPCFPSGGPMAEWIRRAKQLPPVRRDLVDRVKAEIAAGTYETPERLDATVDALLADLRNEG